MANKDNEIPISLTVDSSALDDLAAAASDVPDSIDIAANINVDDSELSVIDEIPDSTETEANVTEGVDTAQTIADVHFLASMEKLETVWNIIGTGVDFVTGIGGSILQPFLDIDDAVARINAQTGSGTGLDDVGQFIRDIQAADLGDSVDQISDVVIHATQLHAPIEEATTAALTFTKVFTDQNPTQVMDTLKAAADEFGISITEASDLMTVFFQQGGNKGGDALATVDKYATSWHDMGLSITEALSLVSSLMTGGVDTAEGAAKMVQTFDDAMTTATDPASAQAKMLKMMGVDNPKDQGEAIGAETIDGFVAAFTNLPADQQDLASQLFFGKGGKLNTSAIEGATTESDMFKNVTDAAKAAATEMDNSLRGAVDDFILAINTAMTNLLSSDKIDLPGKITAIKEAIQRGLDEIASGGTIGEGLEVALNIPGLSDTLNTFIGNFERIIGNLEIAFLQVVAAVQDLTGHGTEAQATRQTIFDRSMGQLQFDLQLANADEVDTMIQQAMGRGLNATNVGEALNTAINESIASGNFDQGSAIIEGLLDVDPTAFAPFATDFITKLSGGFDNAMSAGNLDMMQKLMAIDPNAKIPGLDEMVASFQKQLSDAFTPQNRAGDTGGNPFLTGIGAGIGKQGATSQGGGFGGMNAVVQDFKTTMEEAQATAATATGDISTNFDHTSTAVTGSLDTVNTALDTTGMTVEGLDMRVVNALTGNTVTTAFQAVSDAASSSFPIVLDWFDRTGAGVQQLDGIVTTATAHMSKLLHDLQFLSAAVAQGVEDALKLGANLPGAGGGGGGSTTNNTTVNQTNNNSNGAQTAATTYQIAAAVGGAS